MGNLAKNEETLSKPDFELFVMCTWATWNERLRYLRECNGKFRELDADWCENLLREYRAARASVMSGSETPLINSSGTWSAPLIHQFRLDVDAAYKEGSPSCAVGGVIRNHEGQPLLAFGELLDTPQSVTIAELLAIQVGLKIAREHNIQIHHLISDSLLAVQAVTSPEEDLSYVGSITADISILMHAHECSNLIHVRRSANRMAHSIAAFAFSSSSHFVWEHGSFPLWLIKLVIP